MKMNKDLIINEFDRHFINPKCELEYSKDYELLLSVMLSAQTTDKSVNLVTKELYNTKKPRSGVPNWNTMLNKLDKKK